MNSEWILLQDDDGHWYLIPLAKEDYFEDLINTRDYDSLGHAFSVYRIDGPASIIIKSWDDRT